MMQTTENKTEVLKDIFRNMDDDDIVSVWNEYCYNTDNYDDEILSWERLEEYMQEGCKDDPFYWINRFYYGSDDYGNEGGANPNRNYYSFNGYGNLNSFDYIYNQYTDTFNHMDIDDLIDYIIENNEDFCNSDISDFLEECEE